MLTLFESFFLYLKHYAVNSLFAKTPSPFFKNGHFKNVQFQKVDPVLFLHFYFSESKTI